VGDVPLERRTPLNRGTKGLAPGKPLARGSGLSPGKPIARTTPMPRATPAPDRARTAMPKRAQKARTPARKTGTTPEVRAIVHDRDKGLCVRCGQPATDQDHRKGRGAGGTKGEESTRINQPAWILTLCGHGNTSGCHGWKESNPDDEAARLGYKIPRNGVNYDAELVPVFTRFGWVRFDNQGKVHPVPDPPGMDARNVP
jgi:hypothetical protein